MMLILIEMSPCVFSISPPPFSSWFSHVYVRRDGNGCRMLMYFHNKQTSLDLVNGKKTVGERTERFLAGESLTV